MSRETDEVVEPDQLDGSAASARAVRFFGHAEGEAAFLEGLRERPPATMPG